MKKRLLLLLTLILCFSVTACTSRGGQTETQSLAQSDAESRPEKQYRRMQEADRKKQRRKRRERKYIGIFGLTMYFILIRKGIFITISIFPKLMTARNPMRCISRFPDMGDCIFRELQPISKQKNLALKR